MNEFIHIINMITIFIIDYKIKFHRRLTSLTYPRLTQIVCPMGYYCPSNSALPSPCRNGTYGDQTNLMDAGECRPCDPGYYCNDTAAVGVAGPCYPG